MKAVRSRLNGWFWGVALGLLIFPSTPVRAAVIPSWDATSPIVIPVPREGSLVFPATGQVELGTLDVMLVYDVSGSMAEDTKQKAPNGGTQRGDWAEAGAAAFVRGLPAVARLAVTQFKGNSRQVVPLELLGPQGSPHRAEVLTAIDEMPRNGLDGTNIDLAITYAAGLLSRPEVNSDSKHLVVVTDGDENEGDAVRATAAAISRGINTVNMVGLPGANASLMASVANTGKGVFVDGTNLNQLVSNFATILNDVEKVQSLEVFLGGSSLGSPVLDGSRQFTFPLNIVAGDNLFVLRATSNLGNVREASLLVRGVVVPEPSSFTMVVLGLSLVLNHHRRKL